MAGYVLEPTAVFEAMLVAPGFRARLGIALGYLARRWPDLELDFCRTGGSAYAIARRFDLPIPATVGEIDSITRRWLQRQRPASIDLILAYLLVVDDLIAPFARTKAVDVLEGATMVGVEPVHVWVAPRGVLHEIAAAAERLPRVKPNTNYVRTLDDHFAWLRHARVLPGRRYRVESVDDETQHDLEKLCALACDDALRVGLYSLRGPFEPELAYSRTTESGGLEWQLFLAHDVEPESDYCARIRTAIWEAGDPEKPLHIVVFPEFMMTAKGVASLRSALAESAKAGRARPPLIFAGSAHMQRDDGKWVNCCIVFDHNGRELWRQWKQVPFGDEEADQLIRTKVKHLPPTATGRIRLVEDIERSGEYLIGRTPLGSFGVAICADMVTGGEDSPLVAWTVTPVDWVVIPAYTPATRRFYEAAGDLIQTRKVVLFANAYPAIPPTPPPGPTAQPTPIPSVLRGGSGPVLGSFVSTPWTEAVGLWFADPADIKRQQMYWTALQDDFWDGLVIDLASYVRT